MPTLRPCTTCSRHVSVDEARCPFCDGELAMDAHATPSPPAMRLGRAAVMAVGAAVATASIVACNNTPAVTAPTDSTLADAGAATTQGGSNVADASAVVKQPDYSNMAKPYGAPPADGLRRVI
jgi:hypothetical protein